MVEVSGRGDEVLQGLVGRTQGRLRSGLRSVFVGAKSKSGILTGISSRIESAFAGHVTDNLQNSSPNKNEMLVAEVEAEIEEAADLQLPSPPHSLVACGPDPYERLTYKIEAPSSGSEGDGYGPSTSLESSADQKFYVHSEAGRLWFARFVNAQRVQGRRVTEVTFFSLAQFFAIVLFECADADDFAPAKSLMNMCFTFYYEVTGPPTSRQYVFSVLRDQPIFHSLRFWNAAFFEALQCERSARPVATRDDVASNRLEALTDERTYQENITFGQLGTFTSNMHAFGLSRELCLEFLRKQCTIASLSPEQEQMLRDNLENLHKCSSSTH